MAVVATAASVAALNPRLTRSGMLDAQVRSTVPPHTYLSVRRLFFRSLFEVVDPMVRLDWAA